MSDSAVLHRSRYRRALLPATLGLAVVAGGCTRQVVSSTPTMGTVPVAPSLSVERFLQATNARDFEVMARLFGTAEGPVADTGNPFGCAFKRMGSWIGLGDPCMRWEDIELWMSAISEALRHRDYRIVSERLEPGRVHPTNRIGVDLTVGSRVVRDVPFLVVRTPQGSWLVERVDLEKVMG